MYNKQALIEAVKRDALKFGDFTLASGAKSTYYIDCRNVTLEANGAALIGAGMLERIAEFEVDAVGGLTMGADPIVGAVLAHAGIHGTALRGFLVRKEAKDHGTGKLVEGPLRPGDRVAIVEDVATTGGSSLKAVDAVLAAGCTVACVAAVLDRLAGAGEAFGKRGIPYFALLDLHDLGL